MASKVTELRSASEGNKSAARFQSELPLETGGKAGAIRCLHAALESFQATHNLSRDQVAEDICGMSPGYFSKVINGQQGDLFALVEEKLPADVRRDFYERKADLERVDPFAQALERFIVAAFQLIRLSQGRALPQRADRMARAVVRQLQKRGIA